MNIVQEKRAHFKKSLPWKRIFAAVAAVLLAVVTIFSALEASKMPAYAASNIDTDILCGALAEYRQEKRKKKEEEPCIEAVTKQVSAEYGKPLTHEFIGCLIADFFNDAYFEGDPTAAVMSNLSYEELKNLALDSIYRQMIGAFQSKEKEETIKKMNIDPDDLQGAIQDELFRRLITGRIAGT